MRSRLISEIAAEAERRDFSPIRVLSALQQGRLEAAAVNGTAVVDSAPPYCIEPRLPSAFEDVVWLGDCYRSDELRGRQFELAELEAAAEQTFEGGRKLLFAADELLKDNERAALSCCDREKIDRQVYRTAKKLFVPSDGQQQSFISRICFGKGKIELPPDFSLTLLQDRFGGCAQLFLSLLFSEAKRNRCRTAVFYSPLAPYYKIDALILPDSKICFAVEDERLELDRPADSIINSRRFADRQRTAQIMPRLKQNQKTAALIFDRSRQLFEQSNGLRHNKEKIYSVFEENAKFDKVQQTLSAKILP